MDRTERKQVIEQTLQACEAGGYQSSGGHWVTLDMEGARDRAEQGRLHHLDQLPAPDRRFASKSLLHVEDGDCLVHAKELQDRGLSVCCLNMASFKTPGGGYLSGAGAQEENLFRRSNYHWFIESTDHRPAEIQYPLPEFAGIYSHNVDVFRGPEEQWYPFLDEPYQMSFVAVAGYYKPPVAGLPGMQQLAPPYDEKMRKKIQLTLRIPLQHGHNAVVLSALGCGAFASPPGHVAELFAEEIERGGFRYAYRHILFAVLDDHNAVRPGSPDGNFRPFRKALHEA